MLRPDGSTPPAVVAHVRGDQQEHGPTMKMEHCPRRTSALASTASPPASTRSASHACDSEPGPSSRRCTVAQPAQAQGCLCQQSRPARTPCRCSHAEPRRRPARRRRAEHHQARSPARSCFPTPGRTPSPAPKPYWRAPLTNSVIPRHPHPRQGQPNAAARNRSDEVRAPDGSAIQRPPAGT